MHGISFVAGLGLGLGFLVVSGYDAFCSIRYILYILYITIKDFARIDQLRVLPMPFI